MADHAVKVRSWVIDIVPDEVRLRCRYRRHRRQITQFTVQLELLQDGHWSPVIRYDNAHGFCHRDILHADGSQEKEPVYFGDNNETFSRSVAELQVDWQIHRARFLRELEP